MTSSGQSDSGVRQSNRHWWENPNRVAAIALVVSLLSAAATGAQAWFAARQIDQAIQAGPILTFNSLMLYYDNDLSHPPRVVEHRDFEPVRKTEIDGYRGVDLVLQVINRGGQ